MGTELWYQRLYFVEVDGELYAVIAYSEADGIRQVWEAKSYEYYKTYFFGS